MKKNISYVILFALVVLLGWLAWFSIISFASFFSGASDTVKAASIAAFVSVITFLFGRYFEQKRELKQKINSEKIKVYKGFFDFYFDLFSYEKIHGEPKPELDLMKEMLEFRKVLILWGSDSVIDAYVEFKDRMVEFGEGEDDLPTKTAKMMKASANVLASMRKDIGYTFTSFNAKDLAAMQLAVDSETEKVIERL